MQSLPVIIALLMTANMAGMWAIHFQHISLFSITFGLNVVLGLSMFIFHIFQEPKVRYYSLV